MKARSISSKIVFGDLAVWSLQGLLAGIFLAAGVVQLIGLRAEVRIFDEIGLGQWLRVITGLVQVGGAIALISPRTASIGGLSLTIMMVGAAVASFTVLPVNPGPAIALAFLSSLIAYLRRDTLFSGLQPSVARIATAHHPG